MYNEDKLIDIFNILVETDINVKDCKLIVDYLIDINKQYENLKEINEEHRKLNGRLFEANKNLNKILQIKNKEEQKCN